MEKIRAQKLEKRTERQQRCRRCHRPRQETPRTRLLQVRESPINCFIFVNEKQSFLGPKMALKNKNLKIDIILLLNILLEFGKLDVDVVGATKYC